MRPVPNKPIKAKAVLLGGSSPLVCVPLVGKDREAVLAEARNLAFIAPDVIELRIDAWDCIESAKESVALIAEVRGMAKELPIILTCRGHWEGGFKEVSEAAKDAVYGEAIDKALVDFIDKELSYGPATLAEWKRRAEDKGVSLIVSYHNFKETPSREFVYAQMARQISCGADVAKVAVMPQKEEDVLTLLSATLAIRRDFPDVPLITMSMGPLGSHSRVVGGLYGSDLTFAVGSAASAPGQIPVAQMRSAFELMYPKA